MRDRSDLRACGLRRIDAAHAHLFPALLPVMDHDPVHGHIQWGRGRGIGWRGIRRRIQPLPHCFGDRLAGGRTEGHPRMICQIRRYSLK